MKRWLPVQFYWGNKICSRNYNDLKINIFLNLKCSFLMAMWIIRIDLRNNYTTWIHLRTLLKVQCIHLCSISHRTSSTSSSQLPVSRHWEVRLSGDRNAPPLFGQWVMTSNYSPCTEHSQVEGSQPTDSKTHLLPRATELKCDNQRARL